MIHLFEFRVKIGIGGRSHDAEKFLCAYHELHPVCPSLAERLHGFVTHGNVIRPLVGKHDAVGERHGILVVGLVETFQRDLCPGAGTVLYSRRVLVRGDIFHPVPFIDELPVFVRVPHGRVGRQLIVTPRTRVDEPFRRERVGQGEAGGELFQRVAHARRVTVPVYPCPERQGKAFEEKTFTGLPEQRPFEKLEIPVVADVL